MSNVVLREGPRVLPDFAVERRTANSEDTRIFRVDCANARVSSRVNDTVVMFASGERSDHDISLWRAAGKKRRVPERADGLQSFAPRHQKAKAVQGICNSRAVVGRRHYTDWRVFDAAE